MSGPVFYPEMAGWYETAPEQVFPLSAKTRRTVIRRIVPGRWVVERHESGVIYRLADLLPSLASAQRWVGGRVERSKAARQQAEAEADALTAVKGSA